MNEKIPQRIEIKEKFEQHYKELLGDRYGEFIDYSTSYIRKSIRVNTLKIEKEKLAQRLSRNWNLKQVPWCPEGYWIEHKGEARYDIGNLIEHVLGYIYVQDAASMIPPVVLSPEPGEQVLDMCAAPGSKTSQMAAMMDNQGVLIANDLQADRLAALGINIQRMGVRNALITQMDGNSLRRKDLRFDRILVDAPCSGTGTIRRSLLTLKMWGPNLVKKMSLQQRQLAATAFDCLRPGGTMVYSTCTMEPEENEGVVSWLLENRPEASIEKINLDIKRSPAITGHAGISYRSEVKDTLRIWPQDNDTEGFFVAKIRRAG